MVDIVTLLFGIDRSVLAIAIILLLTIEVFMLSFPKEVVLIFSGVAFGTVLGSWINLAGLVFAAILGHQGGISGRWVSETRLNQYMKKNYVQWVNTKGNLYLFFLRLFPFTPNDILSITCGYMRLKRLPYTIITTITAIPYAILWAYLGSEQLDLVRIFYDENFNPVTWFITFIFIVYFAFVITSKMSTKIEPGD